MKVIFSSSLNSFFLSCLLLLLLRTWVCQRGSIWRCHEETMKLIEVGVGCGSNQSERTLSHPPPNRNAFGTIKLHSPEGWNSFVILLKNSVVFEICFYFFYYYFFPLKKMAVFSSVRSVAQQNFVSAVYGLYSLLFYPPFVTDTLFTNASFQRKICIYAIFIRAFFFISSHFISNHYWSSFYWCL